MEQNQTVEVEVQLLQLLVNVLERSSEVHAYKLLQQHSVPAEPKQEEPAEKQEQLWVDNHE